MEPSPDVDELVTAFHFIRRVENVFEGSRFGFRVPRGFVPIPFRIGQV